MSDYIKISIDITLEAANDSVFDTPHPRKSNQLVCEHWASCENPCCFKYGCLNVLRRLDKEVRS